MGRKTASLKGKVPGMKNKILSQKPLSHIASVMKDHYEDSFRAYGPNSSGVDWGIDTSRMFLRYDNMLAILDAADTGKAPTLLDVGCGYGGLANYARQKGVVLNYTGIDIATNMISWAKKNVKKAKFIENDFLNHDFSVLSYDYVICNGILTQKLDTSLRDMDVYAKSLIRKMYGLCNKAIAFNMMTTYVNFFAPNLYYKHPAEIMSYCLSEISTKVKIDHSYGLYEFTAYIYK